MEYFNFEDASHILPHIDFDELDSLTAQTCQSDANECFDSLFFDKSAGLLPAPSAGSRTVKLKLINNVEIEAIPHESDLNADYPMFRAKQACDLCAKNGLDCFLATRGALVTGCTCCISLYRECSFVHEKTPKGFVNTFVGIAEDEATNGQTMTERKKVMRSMEEGRGRKTGARFPRDAVKILKQWLSEHADHPYPNEREKDELKQITGLKRSQISNWLANARRRGKVRPAEFGPSSPMLGAVDIPQRPQDPEFAKLNPLDRWKVSPPEHEPASMTAIARAVTATPLPAHSSSGSSLQGSRPTSRPGSKPSSRNPSSEEDSSFSMFRAPSISSFGTKESSNSDMTFGSSRSNRSRGSFASSQDRRRRRRAPVAARTAAQQTKSRAARIFQCTFCTDSFPAKYDWQRHEKSLHLALERWSCCPTGGSITDALTGMEICVFCREANPSADHLESHNFTACQEKTVQERTFYRKDHLSQHLKLMHNSKVLSHMDNWKSTTNEIKSACGFCPSKFTTWQQRADHLAAHFRNGADMSNWANGWGFEPHVERLVENAIPPYLIGHERNTMEPYVARFVATPSSTAALTIGTSAESSEPDQMTKDSNCWGRLEQELAKFVSQQRALGVVPSDKDLQDQGRLIIYEDNDPWNWTCADNQQWLDTFKVQHGIGGFAEVVHSTLYDVPIMAPYVIKGGLKTKGATSHSRSASGSLHAASPHGGMPNAAVVEKYDNDMELDFDSVDFSNLDLADEMNFEVGGGIPISTTPYSSSIPGQTLFGSYGPGNPMELGMVMNPNVPVQQHAKQQNGDQFMSEQSLTQLSGYVSGYN